MVYKIYIVVYVLPLALFTSRFSHALHEAQHYVHAYNQYRFPCMHMEKEKGEVETIPVLPKDPS